VWDDIIDFTSDMILKLVDMFKPLIDIFVNVKDKIGDIASKIKTGAVDLASRVIKVDDAIITPKGDVIQPADDDFIIATKDPNGLGGGQTINFDFSGAMITNKEQFMDDIKMNLGRGAQLRGLGI